MAINAEPSADHAIPLRSSYVFLALAIPVAIFAFWKSYFQLLGIEPDPFTRLVHVHTVLMFLWCAILACQATLARMGRFKIHRWIGRSSYVVAPIIIWTGLGTIHGFFGRTPDGLTLQIARLHVLAFGMVLAYAVTWGLAIVYRKSTPLHARFMISTAFAIGTAVVWRIFYYWVPGCGNDDAAVIGNWIVLSLPLLVLIAFDWRRGMKRSPFWVVLLLITLGHVGYWSFANTEGWHEFCQWFTGLPSWMFLH